MIHQFRSILVCSLVLAGTVVSAGQAAPAEADKVVASASNPINGQTVRLDDRYRIGFRDKLTVQVFRHPELTQTVSVNSNGTISLFKIPTPLIAVCKTESELARAVEDAYRKDYLRNPEVNVAAIEQNSQALAVIGAVEHPGRFFVNRQMHLLELLALAGGPSKEAGSRLMVVRPGSDSGCQQTLAPKQGDSGLFNFSIRDLQEGKQTFAMQPGDIVSVLEADIVFVYGNVNEQGQVVMKQPMTLTQAIASAKGIKPATQRDKVRIIRQKPGSLEREEIIVDLGAIDKQKAKDPYLLPNDIIALSQDKTMSIINSLTKSLTQGIPSLLYRPY